MIRSKTYGSFSFLLFLTLSSDSFIEISRFYQGIVENEKNLNPDESCRFSCSDFTRTKHFQCAENTFCRRSLEPWEQSKLLCKGEIVNCQYFDGNLKICPAVSALWKIFNFIIDFHFSDSFYLEIAERIFVEAL